MDREILEKKLSGQKAILDAIDGEIVTAERELETRQEAYSQSLLRQAEGQRASGLDAQLRRQTDAQGHLDGLKKARVRAEETLRALEKDLELVDLYETHGVAFQKSKSACEQALQTIGESASLDGQIQGLTNEIETLFKGLEASVSHLSTVNKNLDGRYSLSSFLEGELVLQEEGQEDRGAILEQIGAQLKGFGQVSLAVDQNAVKKLAELLPLFPLWQAKVNSLSGKALATYRYSLQPRAPKPVESSGGMGVPHPEVVEANPQLFAPRDIAWAKRVRGIDPDVPTGGRVETLGGR